MTDYVRIFAILGVLSWLSGVYIVVAAMMDWPGIGVASGVILLGLPATVTAEIMWRVVARAIASIKEAE